MAASRTRTEMDPTDLALAWLPPITLFFAVDIGIRMASSWSCPQVFWPFLSRTPTTVNGTFLMRMTWPSGSASPKRFWLTVWPSRATLAAPSTSSWVRRRPSITPHSRAVKYSGVIPCSVVPQLRLP